nr:hypothetical protein OH837_49310 [Streptomyces canus]
MTATTTSGWDALEARLNSVKKPVRTFKLCDDADIRDRYRTATQEAERAEAVLNALAKDADPDARALLTKELAAAQAELKDATKQYDAHTIVLTFTALDRKDLEKLQTEHPPTEQDEADGHDYAVDSFGPALVSAASLDGMPVEAARRYLDTWSSADAGALWQAAWSIQHQQRTDLGKG